LDWNSEGRGRLEFGIPKAFPCSFSSGFLAGEMAIALLESADLLTFLVRKSSTNRPKFNRTNIDQAGVSIHCR